METRCDQPMSGTSHDRRISLVIAYKISGRIPRETYAREKLPRTLAKAHIFRSPLQSRGGFQASSWKVSMRELPFKVQLPIVTYQRRTTRWKELWIRLNL
jgi:hypothetical protein